MSDEPWGPNHPDWKLNDEEEAAWRLAHPGQSYEDYRDDEPDEGHMPFADDEESGNDPDEVDPGVDRIPWPDIQRMEFNEPEDVDDNQYIIEVNRLHGFTHRLTCFGPFDTEDEAREFATTFGWGGKGFNHGIREAADMEGSDWWIKKVWRVK